MDISKIMTGDTLLYKDPRRRYAQRVTALAVNLGKQRVMLVLANGKTKIVPVATVSQAPRTEVEG